MSAVATSRSAASQQRLLRVLHVGVSNRGIWPLRHCNPATGFQPAALCDVNAEALAKARQLTGLPESAAFTDFDRALARSDVDCVIICTPTILHVSMALRAIEAGLPVLVEKGMAPDWSSAARLVRVAEQHGAKVAVAQNYRYCGHERTIHRAIHDRNAAFHVGDVHLVTYAQNRVRPHPRTLTYPFASVWDMSCHHFDNLLYWLAPVRWAPPTISANGGQCPPYAIVEMTAFSWRAPWSAYEHDNNTTAHIVFANGTHVHYIHTHDAARSSLEVQVHGKRGALFRREDELSFSERPAEQFGTRPSIDVPLEEAHGEADLLRDFYRWITEDIEPGISVRNNLETMAACEMMVRSITGKRTVRREELA